MSEPDAQSRDVDTLFKLPLAEFTAARNALVARLRKTGRQAEANDVKALAKPSVSAWVVNQLYWQHRDLFDRLIEAGDRVRRAHASRVASDPARGLAAERRDAVMALEKAAADIARDGDHGTARDLMRRVTSTLEALSIYGSQPGAPAAGRLTQDLEPPGFEAAASVFLEVEDRTPRATGSLARSSPARPLPPRPRAADPADRRNEKEHKRLVATAKAAVEAAQRALSAARKHAQRAAEKLETAAARAKSMDEQRAEMEKRLARAAKDADAARQHEKESAANASDATQAAEAAERTLELARRELRKAERGED